MLDDLKYIHMKDANDALGVAGKQASQLNHDFGVKLHLKNPPQNIILAGMGGSALPGGFISSWPRPNLPFEIVRNYELPAYISESTLFISSSYSGNTEETLSALAEAEQKSAQIVVIAAGGELARQAEDKGYPLYKIPQGIQPRMSSFYFLRALTDILAGAGLVKEGSALELQETASWLESEMTRWRAEIPSENNIAKQIALELVGKTVIVYSGPNLAPAANKWKICMNENAKNLAWWNQYPEFNHNEFIGWTSHPVDKPFAVVEIRSNLEHERVQKRFAVSERLVSGKRPAPIVVEPVGGNILSQLVWTSALGDHVSIYLALLNGLNPTPVDLVEKFKAQLNN